MNPLLKILSLGFKFPTTTMVSFHTLSSNGNEGDFLFLFCLMLCLLLITEVCPQ